MFFLQGIELFELSAPTSSLLRRHAVSNAYRFWAATHGHARPATLAARAAHRCGRGCMAGADSERAGGDAGAAHRVFLHAPGTFAGQDAQERGLHVRDDSAGRGRVSLRGYSTARRAVRGRVRQVMETRKHAGGRQQAGRRRRRHRSSDGRMPQCAKIAAPTEQLPAVRRGPCLPVGSAASRATR